MLTRRLSGEIHTLSVVFDGQNFFAINDVNLLFFAGNSLQRITDQINLFQSCLKLNSLSLNLDGASRIIFGARKY